MHIFFQTSALYTGRLYERDYKLYRSSLPYRTIEGGGLTTVTTFSWWNDGEILSLFIHQKASFCVIAEQSSGLKVVNILTLTKAVWINMNIHA